MRHVAYAPLAAACVASVCMCSTNHSLGSAVILPALETVSHYESDVGLAVIWQLASCCATGCPPGGFCS